MKHLLTQLGAALIMLFALTSTATAQTMVGLPQAGVGLEGSPSYPSIVNASHRDILGYMVHFQDANGDGPIVIDTTTGHVRRGEPALTTFAIEAPAIRGTRDAKPIVTVTLAAVLFSDGEYVEAAHSAAPEQNFDAFAVLSTRLDAERLLGQQVASVRNSPDQQSNIWSQVASLAVPNFRSRQSMNADAIRMAQQMLAYELLRTRSKDGDGPAYDIAERAGKLPVAWRKK